MCAVRTNYGLTEWFNIKSGVRQGCVLSPLLFIIYMDQITKEANPNSEEINELLFADDQCLLHEDEEQLQDHIQKLDEACTKYDMRISTEKTETMVINRISTVHNIKINDMSLKQVREFKYLGSLFTEDGNMTREIDARIQKANHVNYQLTPILKHQHVPIETKRQLINTIFLPTLCYQAQTWTISKRQQQKIVACEMRCLRKSLNKTRRDKIRNEEIRKTISIQPVMHFIEKQRMKWFGHLVRMNQDDIPARIYNSRCSEPRHRGRPRKRWIQGIEETASRMNLTKTEASHLALERRLFYPTTLHG